jgi:serine/threonine protein kinase
MSGVLSVGDVLDNRYEILSPLAEGGMGAVYRARRRLLGDEVALKIIRPDLTNSTAGERFLRESRVAASLRHPAIVAVYDFDMQPGRDPFLVMELLSGPSLKDEISVRGRFDPADVQRIIPPICSALHLAHGHGIVHRDIKPANIVAHEYPDVGRVYKIVDFGVANLRHSTEETTTGITAAHQFVGTVVYAPPEQLTAAGVDARSDVYSLAIVIFEMIAGRVPFESSDPTALVTAHLTTSAPRLRSIRPDVPAWLDAAVAKGLAKRPEERWQTMAELGAALNPADADTSAGAGVHVSARQGLGATYEIGESLGRGRLGSEVFRGVHRTLGHPVAVRILQSSAPNWTAARERFLQEARSLQVTHPSVLQVRDYGEEPDCVYLVTDFIEGQSLRDVIRQQGAIPWIRLRPLIAQLLDAARVLHRRKILLCGLNPDIIRIRAAEPGDGDVEEAERLMISTGGICQAQDLLATLNERTLRGLALDDIELRYVAPELLTGASMDVRSDVFTIGALIYEMATGRPPYDGASMQELLGRMLAGAPDDPRAVRPEIPEDASSAMLRALAPSPANRFGSVSEFGTAAGIRP